MHSRIDLRVLKFISFILYSFFNHSLQSQDKIYCLAGHTRTMPTSPASCHSSTLYKYSLCCLFFFNAMFCFLEPHIAISFFTDKFLINSTRDSGLSSPLSKFFHWSQSYQLNFSMALITVSYNSLCTTPLPRS